MPFALNEFDYSIHIAILALCFAGVCFAVYGLIVPHQSVISRISVVYFCANLASILVFGVLNCIQGWPDQGWCYGLQICILGAACCFQQRLSAFVSRRRFALPFGLLLSGLVIAGGIIWVLHRQAWRNVPAQSAEISEVMFKKKWFPSGVIQTGAADSSAVCHDFTFFESFGIVHNSDIEGVLRQYGFERTESPQIDDVIIYHDSSGIVVHSGIVKAVGKNNFVLIESKWGAQGRFLHEAKVHGIHHQLTYYRPNAQRLSSVDTVRLE